MPKILTISVALFLLYSQAFAQKSFLGVDAGINVANLRTHVSDGFGTATSYQNNLRFTGGAFYQYGFTEKMGLRLTAQYMGLGYVDQGFSVNINYLTFPLNFQYFVTPRLSFNTGPYLSFTLGGTRIYNQAITSIYHKNDHGLSIGGTYEFHKNICISIGYVIGLKNILLADTIKDINGNTGTITYNNRALQLTLIYKFTKPS